MTRRSSIHLLAWALLLLGSCAPETTGAAAPRGPHHWRITWTEHPQTRAIISWSTARAGSTHRVHYDTAPRSDDITSYEQAIDAQVNGRFTGAADTPELHYHHATLTGLRPATRYYFRIVSDDVATQEFWFQTAPTGDVDISIIQGGDSRSDPAMRRDMNRRIAQTAAAHPDVLCFAHGGDYVYSGTDLNQWIQWLSDHELTTGEDGRMLPVVPTRGNHESVGALFDEVFGSPGGGLGKNYFKTLFTPEILLVTLNTEIPRGGPQTRFLEDVSSEHRNIRWKVAQYHRPIWPAVKLADAAKFHWQPVFDNERYDLVCEADGHTLKRTPPILGNNFVDDGVVYIGEGGLGVPQRTPFSGSRLFLQSPGHAASAHHVWKLDFTAAEIRCAAIGKDGTTLDTYTCRVRDRAALRLDALERELLAATKLELGFQTRSEGIVKSAFDGTLKIEGDVVELEFSGEFMGKSNRVSLRAEGETMSIKLGRQEPTTLARPRALGEGVLLGLTRMGILHNLARLFGGAAPEGTDGNAREWVQSVEPALTEDGAVGFGLVVGGNRSGDAKLEFGDDGLPARRTQEVEFGPRKQMRVVEVYEVRQFERE